MDKLYIVCDYRESFPSVMDGDKVYNDHISKKSLDELINSLKSCGYDTEYFGGIDSLMQCYYAQKELPSGIYVNLNDGLTQKHKRGQTPLLLEMLNVPYTGADVFHTLLASDKYFTTLFLQQNNILCPKSLLVSSEENINMLESINLPVIVKPNYEGSSIGISSKCFCSTFNEARNKIYQLLEEFDDILVQEYISGYEVTNILLTQKKSGQVLFNEALILSLDDLLYLNNEIFGAAEKYYNLRKYHLAEQVLSPQIVKEIKQTSEKINSLMHLSNYTRFDYRICGEKVFFIEVNTNPALGRTSDVGKCCKLLNIPFEQFIALFAKTII